MKQPLNRRTFLRGAGGVAVGLPFLEAMRPRKASAQSSAVRRVIFEFKANGDEVDQRFTSLDEQNFGLGEFLEPLEPYRDDLLFLHRINKNFGRLSPQERPDNHQQGCASLAAWGFGEGDFPVGGESRTVGYVLGPSADYTLGQRTLDAHPGLAYRHLVYRVGGRNNDIWNMHAHAGPEGQKNPIIPETDPLTAYTRLFGFLGQEPNADQLAANLEMQKSVLDLVGNQLKTLKGQVAYEDRQRLDLHAEALRDLERMLAGGDVPPACAELSLDQDIDPYGGSDHVRAGHAFFKIMAMALACDLTRVVNFAWSGSTNDRVYRNLGIEDGHHTISHQSDAGSFAQIRSIHRHLWENTTPLYEELMALPEGDGTLWDNTLVVHWNELGQGDSHSLDDNLVVLAGGAGGYFKKGRLLDYEKRGAFTDVLTTCFHYMGFSDVEKVGDPRLSETLGGDGTVLA